jgi:hypothetical protein
MLSSKLDQTPLSLKLMKRRSVPAATRNVFRILDQPSSGFDSNLLVSYFPPDRQELTI